MSDVIVYSDGELELNVSVDDDTIWLSQMQISELFDTSTDNISLHIKNIYKEKELDESSTVEDFSVVRQEGNRSVKRNIKHYNLDIIISVGYRVSSLKATKFRQWATSVLKNYVQNGYAINTHKLTQQRLSSLEDDLANIKLHIKKNTLEIKQGLFYDGQIFDAYAFISNLVKSAKTSIVLIDNYIDDSTLTLFSKNSSIKFTIYTQSIPKQLQLDIKKYNKQYNNLATKTTKKFHDRFLIIDDEVFHFGASLKDLGNKIFAVNKMGISKDDIMKGI
nr:RhuM family protein [uncultured Sulfurimonas sp.]